VREFEPRSAVGDRLPLFHPHVPASAREAAFETLSGRWIGQGPQVDKFEAAFSQKFAGGASSIAVSAATHALHLAYILAGVSEGDEVIAPVFSCAATSFPVLYQRGKVRFADIQPGTLNVDPKHVRSLITPRTKAIVCVHYAGLPCDMDELVAIAKDARVALVSDAAQALGSTYRDKPIGEYADFCAYSFQAIKHITTGDGGMLVLRNRESADVAKRLRWFGIDRAAKLGGVWENEIREVGFKYHMNDIAASMGLAALEGFDAMLAWRQKLFARYCSNLQSLSGVEIVGASRADRTHAAWAFTILVDRRADLERRLLEKNIESGQVHFRNDRYAVFASGKEVLPAMDAVQDKYLLLPLHMKMSTEDVDRVCGVLKEGW